MKKAILALAALAAFSVSAAAQSAIAAPRSGRAQGLRGQARVEEQVRHALVMLPQYGAFDILKYEVRGDTVILSGAVRDAVLQPEAESAVKHIEGVEHVVDQIKVLSPSAFDDDIRLRVARKIFSAPGMMQYGMGVVPPVHIIVDGGHVTLEGVVNSESAKNLATLYANQVPYVFSVTNNLQVGS